VASGGTGTSESQRTSPCQADPPRRSKEQPASARQLYDGSDRPDSDSLQRCRTRGEVDGLCVDTTTLQVVESGGTTRYLQSLLIQGGRAPDVHVSLVAGGGQGPTPIIAGVRGSAPERTGERVATVEAADRSRAAPESVGSKRAGPEQGSKRVAPEQGSSYHLTKKPWVRSKM
jgi:hypothetical protein